MPQGYATIVGEREFGSLADSVSIGARALYNNPKVLILDEATSALDNLTEQSVMDELNNLGQRSPSS